MAAYTRHILSGSTNGRPIPIVAQATTTSITTIHTAATGTGGSDEIYLYVANMATAAREVTARIGGTTSDDAVRFSVPSQDGLYLLLPGVSLNNGLILGCQATATTGEVKAVGWVNRIAT